MLPLDYDIWVSSILLRIFWLSEFIWFYSRHIMIHSVTKESVNTDEFEPEFWSAENSDGSIRAGYQAVSTVEEINNISFKMLTMQSSNISNNY